VGSPENRRNSPPLFFSLLERAMTLRSVKGKIATIEKGKTVRRHEEI
jgi:hypothetical protein